MSNSASISRRTPVADYSATLQNIRRLIYLYLFLLIIEGALRKWIVPQFSNPLLLVRDPVVLAIYLLAWRAHIFPRNAFISSLATIGILPGSFPSSSSTLMCLCRASCSLRLTGFAQTFCIFLSFLFSRACSTPTTSGESAGGFCSA